MQIDTQPPGALVYLNNEEIGRTPVRRDFMWYGDYDVIVRKEGYETIKTHKWLVAPIWQWPPIDLFAELFPMRLMDQKKMNFTLEPASTQPVQSDEILARASELEGMLESSRYFKSKTPTTAPLGK